MVQCVGPDLRHFADCGAETFFAESADYLEPGENFIALKFWLAYQLLVNPHQPAEPLIRTFLDGYYGAAAPAMRRWLAYLTERIDRDAQFMMARSARSQAGLPGPGVLPHQPEAVRRSGGASGARQPGGAARPAGAVQGRRRLAVSLALAGAQVAVGHGHAVRQGDGHPALRRRLAGAHSGITAGIPRIRTSAGRIPTASCASGWWPCSGIRDCRSRSAGLSAARGGGFQLADVFPHHAPAEIRGGPGCGRRHGGRADGPVGHPGGRGRCADRGRGRSRACRAR